MATIEQVEWIIANHGIKKLRKLYTEEDTIKGIAVIPYYGVVMNWLVKFATM